MNIGVDATFWQNKRGYGRHGRALLSALVESDKKNAYTFVLDSLDQTETIPSEVDVNLVSAGAPTAVAAAATRHRSYLDMVRMGMALSNPKYDLLLFPSVYSYVPVVSRARKIVIIHDIIAETFPELTLPNLRARLFWKAKVALGRMQADTIVTVSEYSRQCIINHFGTPAERVSVVGEASDPIFSVLDDVSLTPSLEAAGIINSEKYVVYVGGFGPHKNLEVLVRAFSNLVGTGEFSDVRLVMVGENKKEVYHSYFDQIKALVENLGLEEKVIFTGFLSDSDLVILLNMAVVSVLPSLMEGFGLPAVEAAACGCPVIATIESPLPQILADGGIYIDPRRQDDLERAMRRVLGSEALQTQMRQAALDAANKLTWDLAAQQLMDVIEGLTLNGTSA
jgi:glycosyltransferase involved in cell wall biosynthesis